VRRSRSGRELAVREETIQRSKSKYRAMTAQICEASAEPNQSATDPRAPGRAERASATKSAKRLAKWSSARNEPAEWSDSKAVAMVTVRRHEQKSGALWGGSADSGLLSSGRLWFSACRSWGQFQGSRQFGGPEIFYWRMISIAITKFSAAAFAHSCFRFLARNFTSDFFAQQSERPEHREQSSSSQSVYELMDDVSRPSRKLTPGHDVLADLLKVVLSLHRFDFNNRKLLANQLAPRTRDLCDLNPIHVQQQMPMHVKASAFMGEL
jgi:hypothetical protein